MTAKCKVNLPNGIKIRRTVYVGCTDETDDSQIRLRRKCVFRLKTTVWNEI